MLMKSAISVLKVKEQKACLGERVNILENMTFKLKPELCWVLVKWSEERSDNCRNMNKGKIIRLFWSQFRHYFLCGAFPDFLCLSSIPCLYFLKNLQLSFLSMPHSMLYLPIFLTFFPTGLWTEFGVSLLPHNIPTPT